MEPLAKAVGEVEALEHISGVFGEVAPLLVFASDDEAVAFAAVQMDANRSQHFLDLFVGSHSGAAEYTVDAAVAAAAAAHPDWELWAAFNSKAEHTRRAVAARGFEALRYYFSLETKELGDYPALPPGVAVLRVRSEAEFARAHFVQQAAYADHFGFAPRSEADWVQLTRRAPAFDPAGIFLLTVDGEPAGYLECTDACAHRGSGYVHGVGVRPQFRRRGLGRLLVDWAKGYCVERGFAALELNVDSANPTGALRLYQRAGFTVFSAWEQWRRGALGR